MKKSKKIVAIVCVMALAISCFAGISVSAKTISRTYLNCDELPDVLPLDGSTLTLDTNIKSEGSASIKVTTNPVNGNFDIQLPCTVFDATNYDNLYFDIYAENPDILSHINDLYYQFNAYDTQRVRDIELDSGAKLMYQYGKIQGWTTIVIPVADLLNSAADMEHVGKFRLINYSGVWDDNPPGQSFWIDNIRFGFDMEAGEALLSSCDVAYPGAWSTAEVSTDHASEGNTSLKVTLDAEGKMEIVQGVKQSDITDYEYLCFDVWAGGHYDVLAKTNELCLRLDADDSHTYNMPAGTGYTFTAIDGWTTVCISTANLAQMGMDLEHIVKFHLFNSQGVWGGQAGCTFYIDNIRATHEKPDFRYGGDEFCALAGGVSVALEREIVSDGDLSLKFTVTNDGFMGFYYAFDTVGYNVDDYEYLKFDVYSENPVIFAARNNMMLRMNGLDVPQVDVSPYLCGPTNIITANEWHTYCIPTSALRSAGINLQSVTTFFLFNDGGASESFVGQSFYLDNIRFSMTNAAGDCEHDEYDMIVLGGKETTIFEYGETGEVWCYVTGTKVSENVKFYAYGDLNGDDEVDILDFILMKKHILSPETVTIVEGTGDINGDEVIANAEDLVAFKTALISYEKPLY